MPLNEYLHIYMASGHSPKTSTTINVLDEMYVVKGLFIRLSTY